MSIAALLALATAWAGDPTFYLESSPLATRAEAAALVREVTADAIPAKIVRIYVPEQGWRYVVRSEPTEAVDRLTEVAGTVGGDVLFVVSTESGGSTRVGGGSPLGAPDPALDAAQVVNRMARSLSGPFDGAEPFRESYVFRFRRSSEGRVVEHVVARRDDDLFLQVQVVSGAGQSSRAGVVAGAAWTDVPMSVAPDVDRLRRQFDRFSPSRVLGMPAELWRGTFAASDLDDLVVAGEVDVDGEVAIELLRPPRADLPAVSLFVSRASWRLVASSAGADLDQVRRLYSAYGELGDGRVLPMRVETWRGTEQLDVIEVLELDLEPTLPAEWFPVVGG